MKIEYLKKLILEVVKETKEESDDIKKYNPEGLKDKLGAFFIVTKPTSLDKNTQLKDIVFKTTIFYLFNQLDGGLPKEEIVGIFKSKSEANQLANEILTKFKKGIKEVETQAKQYKELKTSLTGNLKNLKNK